MNCNTQNAKIASITEKTLIIGIDVGSETHYARAFDWRNSILTSSFPDLMVMILFSDIKRSFLYAFVKPETPEALYGTLP